MLQTFEFDPYIQLFTIPFVAQCGFVFDKYFQATLC